MSKYNTVIFVFLLQYIVNSSFPFSKTCGYFFNSKQSAQVDNKNLVILFFSLFSTLNDLNFVNDLPLVSHTHQYTHEKTTRLSMFVQQEENRSDDGECSKSLAG